MLRFRFANVFIAAVLFDATSSTALACPKCRLGAAALTGLQGMPHDDMPSMMDLKSMQELSSATQPSTNPAATTPRSPFHPFQLTGGVSVASAYYHRGYLQENQGVIAQPYVTLSLQAFERGDFTITPYVSWWNSLHDEHTFTDGEYDLWYESEIMAGAVIAKGPASIDLKYTLYTYPNGAVGQIDEVGVKFSYDVASFWRKPNEPADFVLLAWVAVDKELSDRNDAPVPAAVSASAAQTNQSVSPTRINLRSPRTAFNKSDDVSVSHAPIFHQPAPGAGGAGAEEGFDTSGQGTYIELGLEPSFRTKLGKTQLGLSFPVTLGLGAGEYYQEAGGENDPLGYVQVGVIATVPLPMPGPGKWYLTGSVSYLHLFADSLQFANFGQSDEVIGSVGIGFSY